MRSPAQNLLPGDRIAAVVHRKKQGSAATGQRPIAESGGRPRPAAAADNWLLFQGNSLEI